MKSKNAVSKNYLSDVRRFTEVCNNELFGGKDFLNPENMRELNPEERLVQGLRPKELKVLEKYRDVLKIYNNQIIFLILGIENQADVNFAMPLRQMLYDVLKYEGQRSAIEREHREKKDLGGAEYISGMGSTDRLIPVVSLVVYWGTAPWNGARTLHEMLDIPPDLYQYKSIINDYRMNLLEIRNMENLDDYSGELKALFGFVRYQKDKEALRRFVDENAGIFRSLTPETVQAISVLGNARELERYLEKEQREEEGIDMCQALEDMILDGKSEGKAEGQAVGKSTEIRVIRRKLEKQMPLQEIADWMELDAAYIRKIADLCEAFPDFTDIQIADRYFALHG